MAVLPGRLRFINSQCSGSRCIVASLASRLHRIAASKSIVVVGTNLLLSGRRGNPQCVFGLGITQRADVE